MKKKVLALFLTTAMVVGLASGCGAKKQQVTQAEIYLPEEITIMVDGTLVATQEEGQEQFVAKLQELTGIKKINIIQPDHSAYWDKVGQTMSSQNKPDVILLSPTYVSGYAAEGILWDMTDAYAGSDLEKRHNENNAKQFIDGVRIEGRLYGMPVEKGGGCVTYVRQAWLDAAGIKTLPTTYDEYIDMLRAFKKAGVGASAEYVTGAAGFIGTEDPFINYLPEFYQDAWPAFYQDADGTWKDGFTEQSMKDALQRIQDAVKEGLLDKASLNATTSDARGKMASNEYGAYTYWANHWATNLTTNIKKANPDQDPTIVALPPIKEVGTYINRVSNQWCVVDDGDDTNAREASIYKYFIEKMQDGAECQFLWTYGVEDVHYSYKAGTVLKGEKKEKTYKDGEFHWLEMISDNKKLYSKMHITATSALSKLANDPNALGEEAIAAGKVFAENMKMAKTVPSTDAYAEYNGDLTTLKNTLIGKVAIGELTVDEAYAEFEKQNGNKLSKAIVDSLNALK